MSDGTLLVFGSVVTFVFAMGVYIYLRGDFAAEEPESQPQPARVEISPAKLG